MKRGQKPKPPGAQIAAGDPRRKGVHKLEQQLAAKKAEVNQIAQVIGKPMVEGGRRLSAQLVTTEIIQAPERTPTPGSNANIARALTGKFGR